MKDADREHRVTQLIRDKLDDSLYVDRGSLREVEYSTEFESAVFEVGTDLQGPDDHGGSDRSLGTPQLDHRAKRPEQAI